jgi:hypothetical protein
MTGDGTSNEHLRVMNKKGLAYVMAIRNSTLQRGEGIMAQLDVWHTRNYPFIQGL